MGQKTKPLGFRLGVNRTWDSRWFGTKLYADQLHQDLKLRKYLFLMPKNTYCRVNLEIRLFTSKKLFEK